MPSILATAAERPRPARGRAVPVSSQVAAEEDYPFDQEGNMDTGILATALEDEHREIDARLEDYLGELAKEQPDARPLVLAFEALRRHIYLEEEFLFPPLREAGLVMPLLVMVREHGQIWDLMESLEAQVRDGAAAQDVDTSCRDLLALLDAHNGKEEPIVYPQADLTLAPDATERLMDFIDSGQMPEGWTCEKATA
jgi:hemerythrin-like domain-containing protein